MIDMLITFIACFASTFGIAYLYYKLSDGKKKINLKTFIVYVLGSIFMSLLMYYEIPIVGAVSYFVYFPILFYLVNPMPIKKLIFYLCVVWIYGFLADLICMVGLSLIYNCFHFEVYSLMFTVTPTILVFVILIILSKLKWVRKLTNFIYSLTKKIDYVFYIIIFFTLFGLILSLLASINVKNFLLVLVIVLTILVLILLMKITFSEFENDIFLNTLKANNDFYIKMDEENRIFKHNLVARLMSIKSVSNKKSIALIDDLIFKFNKNVDTSNSLKEIPYGLNGIIYEKLYEHLNDLNFKVFNNIDYDIFSYLTPKRYNVLVEKLMLVLDNSIESAIGSLEKVLVISINDVENFIEIEVKNTFANEIDIDNLGNKSYSTKGNKRGLGLFSNFRNKEVAFSIKIINNYFVSKIVAKKNKNVD